MSTLNHTIRRVYRTCGPPKQRLARSAHDFETGLAKSQRASRFYSCESIFIIFAPYYVNFRATLLKVCNLHFNIFLDNGVMTTPKRRILSFVFTVLTLKKIIIVQYNNLYYQPCLFIETSNL